jgi:hypothetical protein
MAARLQDRYTPTAVGLVSRAWVIEEVERRSGDPARRAALIDELVGYEPPRQHALRNMFLFWAVAISASALAGALGLPRWSGFAVVVVLFAWLARLLAIKALRWHRQRPACSRSARERKRLSSSALLTTETLENAMAAPAKIGVSSPNAASGMPTTL